MVLNKNNQLIVGA